MYVYCIVVYSDTNIEMLIIIQRYSQGLSRVKGFLFFNFRLDTKIESFMPRLIHPNPLKLSNEHPKYNIPSIINIFINKHYKFIE